MFTKVGSIFFAFRNAALVILLLSHQVVALNLEIHDLTKYCSFSHSFLNDYLALRDSQTFWFLLVAVLFLNGSQNSKELHLAHEEGYIPHFILFTLHFPFLENIRPRYICLWRVMQ